MNAHSFRVRIAPRLKLLLGCPFSIRIRSTRSKRVSKPSRYEQVTKAYLDAGISAEVSPFIDNMSAAFAAADLLVCRSGASTVAEVTAAGKPALFVPFAGAADNHQFKNAELLAKNNAALVIEEKDLNPEKFAQEIQTNFVVHKNVVTMDKMDVRIADGLASLSNVKVEPLAPVTTSRLTFVVRLRISSVAPTSGAFEGSFTKPTIEPSSNCGNAGKASTRHQASALARRFMDRPP